MQHTEQPQPGAGPVDLDIFLREVDEAKPWADMPGIPSFVMDVLETAAALAVELRAARAVIEPAWAANALIAGSETSSMLDLALAAYERAVTGGGGR